MAGDDIPAEATSRFRDAATYELRQQLRADHGVSIATVNGSWSAPTPDQAQDTAYPMSMVEVTQSGHVFEKDDTPDKERVMIQHKSGTHVETLPDGSSVTVINGTDYQIVVAGRNVVVTGNCNLTVNGNCNQLINGEWNLHASGNVNISSDAEIVAQGQAIRLN